VTAEMNLAWWSMSRRISTCSKWWAITSESSTFSSKAETSLRMVEKSP
jgi:hypothetical protein